MSAAETRRAMERWYDDMWSKKAFELVPEIAGPVYTRHEPNGTRAITAEEYRDQLLQFGPNLDVQELTYRLVVEDDMVTAIGRWKLNGAVQHWVQAFRVQNGKLVETWLSGIASDCEW
ncbi:MAG: hypothetical protein R3E88_01470 [Myxococcota bacterium]|nr:hypothetical protein [Myxococcales bacterium]